MNTRLRAAIARLRRGMEMPKHECRMTKEAITESSVTCANPRLGWESCFDPQISQIRTDFYIKFPGIRNT
jgi:hypothetical protein